MKTYIESSCRSYLELSKKVISITYVFDKFHEMFQNSFQCRMKTPENQKFSGVFRGYKTGTLARYGLR